MLRAGVIGGLLLACAPVGGMAAGVGGDVPSYTVRTWETEEGLPQNSVIALTQSREGYLWLGTLNGLVRFDGFRFAVLDENNTPGLESSRIVRLFEDRAGQMWVGTETAGAALIRRGEVTHLDLGRGSSEGRLAAACETPDGAVWLYTADGQLARHLQGRVDIWRLGAERFSQCRALVAESSGLLLVGTDWSVYSLRSATNLSGGNLPIEQVSVVNKLDYLLACRAGGHWRLADGRIQKWHGSQAAAESRPYLWGATPVTAACEDLEGRLLVGTLGAGVFRLEADGGVTRFSTAEGLSNNYILSLAVDREGNLWVGTDGGGLNRVRRQVFATLAEARGAVVQSVCAGEEGQLWMGYNGGGVDRWQAGRLTRFGAEQGLKDLSIRSVLAGSEGRVWVGTWGGGLLRLDREQSQFQPVPGAIAISPVVLALHLDRRGRLWLGTPAGLARFEAPNWRLYTTANGLSANTVRAIAEAADGTLWVGTVGGGLNRFHEDRFTAYRKGATGLPSDTVSSLLMDAEGILWVGTDGGGLARLEGERWTRYTTREGLVSNSVGYLLEDGEGSLWVGSNAGLMRLPKGALNRFAQGLDPFFPCRTYGRADGLPAGECTLGSQPGAARGSDGRLWFPTIKGLAYVNARELDANPHPPPVLIEDVILNAQPGKPNPLSTSRLQPVTLSARDQRLEIQYTSLNLSAPERARFRYRLVGHETEWTEAGSSRVARYSRLLPGDYRFQVTACNEDGVWNPTGATLDLVVLPPFWRTWWFLGLASLTLLGAVVGSVHYFSTQRLQRQVERLRQQQLLEKERSRIARDLHDQLGASLTQLALLGELVESDKDAPAEVESHAQLICQTARETTRVLDEIVWTVNPSNDTLDGLVTYFCKNAQEYLSVAGVRCRLEMPAELPPLPLPPEVRHNFFLAAKEAVTNIVRHARATSAHLRLHWASATFTLEIEDNGRGIPNLDAPAVQARNGLRNMRKRLEDIGGECRIEPAPEGGTRVRLTAPIPPHRS